MIPQVRLEDDVASVAYDIPPEPEVVDLALARQPTQHLAGYLADYEDVRGPLAVTR
jgi:hypothetical protein